MGRAATALRWAGRLAPLALLVLTAVCEWRATYLLTVDQDRLDSAAVRETLAKWREERSVIPKLADDDLVDVFYAEHLLASWVLQASPWNAYHSGMVFRVKDAETGKEKGKYSVDFTPTFTDTVAYVLHPLIDAVYPAWMPEWAGVVYARLTTSYNITWQNHGGTRYKAGIPAKFTNFTMVGTASGATFNKLMDWLDSYDRNHVTFEPVEIVVNGSKDGGMSSSMCHDLFYHALHELTRHGFKPEPRDLIVRDHIMVFAESFNVVDPQDPATRRDIIRYYRMFMGFMDLINQEFTNIRNLLTSADSVAVAPYLYLGNKYYRVELVPPFVNYCYLVVEMPPGKSSVWDSEHMCALEQTPTPRNLTRGWRALAELAQPRNFFYAAEQVVDDGRVWTAALAGLVMGLLI